MQKELWEKIKNILKNNKLSILLLLLLLFLITFEFPYTISKTGGTINLSSRIESENKDIESGNFNMTYVSEVPATLFNLFIASINPNWDIEKQIDTLVQEIRSYQKVAAFGYMQSESIACNLQFDLQTSGKLIFSCFNTKDQADYIADADENNLIIIFSESGTYFDRIFPRAKPFKSNKRKPKICMITSDQSIEYPFIDFYIRYNSKGGYASHPYPLQLISDLICIKYSQLLLNK